nr:immunoglobulin heavy chain junction region [Mus musculus]
CARCHYERFDYW